ncbi:MAG: helix-turn-helix domain-containing protein, partial [Burkholderiales bacterium]
KESRESARTSRAEMAQALGLGDATLWRLENGKNSPTLKQLECMQLAGMDVMRLLTGCPGRSIDQIDDDEGWGQPAMSVSRVFAKHALPLRPGTYWRVVRLLRSGEITDLQLANDPAKAVELSAKLI